MGERLDRLMCRAGFRIMSDADFKRWKAETDAQLDALRIPPIEDIPAIFEEMASADLLPHDPTPVARPWWQIWRRR